MTTNDIRSKYLAFCKERGHALLPSAPLVPDNDPTTLFTGSGMQAILPYLLGQAHPAGTRLADSQKCFRSQDIEEVGDNRHTTFFEMLGNWSLGDYFKKEQIPWFFEFLTDVIGLDPNRLYVTCFIGAEEFNIPKDTEAAMIWQEIFEQKGITAKTVDIGSEKNGYTVGMQGGRIFFYDGKKNWWSRGGSPEKTPVGDPCGPDSEVFYEFIEIPHNPAFGAECHPNCDCGRFMEIGNSVFMTYKRTDSGFEPLPKKNVDFGGGLERIAAAENKNPDIFRIEIFAPLREVVEKVSGKIYGADPLETYAFRVIFDHLRAATMLIGDGVFPSNKDQGYFVRRLIRRSIRFSHKLGIKDNFCGAVADAVIGQYGNVYPNLLDKKEFILTELGKEEQKFRKTLEQGIRKFEEIATKKEVGGQITKDEAFDLYQSFGFPIEITEELAKEHGLAIDMAGFLEEKEKHQALSRQGSEKKFKGGLIDHSDMSVKYHTATHLLHAAVLKILGPHAVQKGSNITPERLRFDFAHPDKLTPEQIQQIEDLVNAAIQRDYPVSFQILPLA
ncbi:MAG TPA: alanine--tRNA ligase, partial [Candidatus Kapabacteria bacterium]|nr:alanine--tRNA ligase [Candidatus Kapabacteria bacterium]